MWRAVLSGWCSCVYSDTWEHHGLYICSLFESVSAARLSVYLIKCQFACTTVMYFGFGSGPVSINEGDGHRIVPHAKNQWADVIFRSDVTIVSVWSVPPLSLPLLIWWRNMWHMCGLLCAFQSIKGLLCNKDHVKPWLFFGLHFVVYVTSGVPVATFTDHNSLTYLIYLKCPHQALMRCSLMLQSYCLDICHIKGPKNTVADVPL